MEITKKEENIAIIRKAYKIIKERYAIHGNLIHWLILKILVFLIKNVKK